MMIHKLKVVGFIVVTLTCFSFISWHHGWSNYDQTTTLNFTGEVLEVGFENPHGMVELKVEEQKWTVILAPPSRMESRGLSKEMLKKGMEATVVGYPHKKIKDEMRAERITIGDKTTELR